MGNFEIICWEGDLGEGESEVSPDEFEMSAGLFFVSVVLGVNNILSSGVTSIGSGILKRNGWIEVCVMLLVLVPTFGSPWMTHKSSLNYTLSWVTFLYVNRNLQ